MSSPSEDNKINFKFVLSSYVYNLVYNLINSNIKINSNSSDDLKISKNIEFLELQDISENFSNIYIDRDKFTNYIDSSIQKSIIIGSVLRGYDIRINAVINIRDNNMEINTFTNINDLKRLIKLAKQQIIETEEGNLINIIFEDYSYLDLRFIKYYVVEENPKQFMVIDYNDKDLLNEYELNYYELDKIEYSSVSYEYSNKVLVLKIANALISTKPILYNPLLLLSALALVKVKKAPDVIIQKMLKLISTNNVLLVRINE